MQKEFLHIGGYINIILQIYIKNDKYFKKSLTNNEHNGTLNIIR